MVAVPVLLVHPPNSSSADTLGCVTSPPDAPGTIDVFANDPPPMLPHPPKSLDDACTAGCGVGALAGGAGSAQALPPQTSEPPPRDDRGMEGVVVAAGAGEGLGWERLNTEEELVVIVVGAAAGAGEEDEAEKSNRSFMAEEDAGAAAAFAGAPKSPNPPKLLCAGLGDGAAGLASKKLPPLRPEKADDD